MACGGQQHVLELAVDVRTNRLAFESSDQSGRTWVLRRDHEVVAPEPDQALGERTIRREAMGETGGKFVLEFLRLDLEEHLDRIAARAIAAFARPIALVLQHFDDQLAAVLERAAGQRRRLIGWRVGLGQQPGLGIAAGAVELARLRPKTEPMDCNRTFKRHLRFPPQPLVSSHGAS